MKETKTVTLEDGNIFVGEFLNGARHGFGRKYYPNGAFYDGYWENDVRHGAGVKTQATGKKVNVEYVNGEKV